MKLPEKILYYGTIALFVYMPFHIFFSQSLSVVTGGLDVWKLGKDIFTILLVTLAVALVVLRKKYTSHYLWLLGFAIVFLMLHLLLIFTTGQPRDTGLLATLYNNRIVWYVLIGYSLVTLLPKRVNPWFFAKLLVVLSTVVCLVGFAQYVLPKDIMTHVGYSVERGAKPNFFIDEKPDLPRVFSTIRDPNTLAAFLILPIVILADALLRLWKTNRRLLILGLLLLHVLVLFLTFSRSGWIGAAVALTALLALRYRAWLIHHKAWLAIGSAAILLVGTGFIYVARDHYVIQNVVFHADEQTKLDDPNELRIKLYQKGIEGIIDHPFGNGPGTAGLVSTRLPNGLLTENYYLQIAYEVGVAGFVLFATFIGGLLWQLWLRRGSLLPLLLLASFVGVAFINLLIHGWANEALSLSWFLLAGLSLRYEFE